MQIKLQFAAKGFFDQIDVVVDSLSSLDQVLKRFGGYMRLKTQKRFQNQGPGWPQLSAHTVAHREHQASAGFEKKLDRELQRAWKTAKTASAIKNRLAVFNEFKRLEAGGNPKDSLLKPKAAQKLSERMQRSKEKAGVLLGGIARSISTEIKGGVLTIFSKIPWAGVHNVGGSGGHGARIPARTFLVFDPEDIQILKLIFIEELTHGKNKG